jgi:hypothetical protein
MKHVLNVKAEVLVGLLLGPWPHLQGCIFFAQGLFL